MRQIIPFKKELLMTTKINEVTSISLEHNINLNNDRIIGDLIITGEYKMTETSINREKFNFNIPIDISLDKEYEYNNSTVDIDNFYYEVINDEVLKVNIDLYVNASKKEIKEETLSNNEIIIEKPDITDSKQEELENNDDKRNNDKKEDILEKTVIYKKIEQTNFEDTDKSQEIEETKDINFLNTNSFNMETYATYYVYIVKEEDTLEKIIEKFNTTKEELSDYNDINIIKKGTKLIIPVKNE